MKENGGPCLSQQVVARFPPHQRLVHPRKGLAVAHGIGQALLFLHHADELVGESKDDLVGLRVRIFGGLVQAAHGPRQSGHGAAAAEAVALDRKHF
jgi:hypothetical protein